MCMYVCIGISMYVYMSYNKVHNQYTYMYVYNLGTL